MSEKTNNKLLFIITLFISGFCGISYEILYSRILGNIIGNHFALNASILVMFLLGIGIGTKISHRFSGFLWAIEGLIGIYAIGFSFATPYFDKLFFDILPYGSLLINTLTCSVLLAIPTVLIGITLPLFAGLFKEITHSEKIFDLSYMIYNFGASITAFIIEFYLIREFGISNSVLIISSLNILTATLLYSFFRNIKIIIEQEEELVYDKQTILFPLILLSASSAIFQLLILKIAEFVFGPFSETFAMIISLTLFGIAIGSMLTRFVKLSFTFFAITNILNLVLVLAFFSNITLLYSTYYSTFSGEALIGWKMFILAIMMIWSSISFGAGIPTLLSKESNIAKESGHLLFISSVANAFGYLMMIFVIHSTFKYGQIFLLIAALLSLAVLLHNKFKKEVVLAIVVINAFGFLSLGKLWNENILYINYVSFSNKSDYLSSVNSYKSGTQYRKYEDVFSLNKIGNDTFFMINGYVSMAMNLAAEYVVGTASSIVSPRIDNALVLGLGSGSTSSTVAQIFKHVDVVEINPIVVEHEHEMKEYNFDIVNAKNVNIVCDDGIRYLKSSEDKKYDLILNTVTSPLYFRSSKLYTTDFIKLVKSKLKDDGVYTTWIDLRIGDEGLDIVLKSLNKEFKYSWAALIKSAYFVLVLSNKDLKLHQEEVVKANKTLQDFFISKHGRTLDDLKYTFVTDNVFDFLKQEEKESGSPIPINTLDKPDLEFVLSKIRHTDDIDITKFKQYIVKNYDFERMDKDIFGGKFDQWGLLRYHLQVDQHSIFTDHFFKEVQKDSPNIYNVLRTDILENTFEKAIKKYNTPQIFDETLYWYYYFNEQDNAEKLLKNQIKKFPKYEFAYRNLATHYMNNKRDFDAEKIFKEHIKLNSDNLDISYYWLGRIYQNRYQFLKAEDNFLASLKLDYTDSTLYYLALNYKRIGEPEKAIPLLKDSINLDPEGENSMYLLADIYYNNKNYFESKKLLENIIKLNPDNKEANELLKKLLVK